MEPFNCLHAASDALTLLDHAHRALRAAGALATYEQRPGLAGDLDVLADALEREADCLFAVWERGVLER